ncbi:MAG: NAD(+)/NADH kinase, partial [Clostridia bacterium]|nr:NAD(+)/NADH kinase [Clostridia bacterium]
MKIAVIPNYNMPDAARQVSCVCGALRNLFAEPMLSQEQAFPPHDIDRLLADCEAAIVLGGDGTIIHCAKRAAAFGKAVLGINCGRLGFMAGLELHELDALERLIRGEYDVEYRMMLDVAVVDNVSETHYSALNEAVVSRGALSRMIEMQVANNGVPVTSYQADGVIVATPTGSTAYSLSAGGPVVDPALHCLLLTPICPHSLHTRPYLFHEDAVLSVTHHTREDGPAVFLTVDGEEAIALPADCEVRITRSNTRAALIKLRHQPFYEILDRKLTNR